MGKHDRKGRRGERGSSPKKSVLVAIFLLIFRGLLVPFGRLSSGNGKNAGGGERLITKPEEEEVKEEIGGGGSGPV